MQQRWRRSRVEHQRAVEGGACPPLRIRDSRDVPQVEEHITQPEPGTGAVGCQPQRDFPVLHPLAHGGEGREPAPGQRHEQGVIPRPESRPERPGTLHGLGIGITARPVERLRVVPGGECEGRVELQRQPERADGLLDPSLPHRLPAPQVGAECRERNGGEGGRIEAVGGGHGGQEGGRHAIDQPGEAVRGCAEDRERGGLPRGGIHQQRRRDEAATLAHQGSGQDDPRPGPARRQPEPLRLTPLPAPVGFGDGPEPDIGVHGLEREVAGEACGGEVHEPDGEGGKARVAGGAPEGRDQQGGGRRSARRCAAPEPDAGDAEDSHDGEREGQPAPPGRGTARRAAGRSGGDGRCRRRHSGGSGRHRRRHDRARVRNQVAERLGFRRRSGVIVPAQPLLEAGVGLGGSAAVPGSHQQPDQPAHRHLVLRLELHRPPSPPRRHRRVARRLGLRHQRPGALLGAPADRLTPAFEPLLEGAGVAHEERRGKLPVHQLEGVPPPAGRGRGLEVHDVGPDARRVEADLVVAPIHEDPLAQLLPQVEKGLPEGIPGSGHVQLRPEHREEGIAAEEATGELRRQAHQKPQPLRLGQDRSELAPGATEVEGAEGLEPDHGRRGWKVGALRDR